MITPWKQSYDQPRHHVKKQRHYFADKSPSSQEYGFSSSHVWMTIFFILFAAKDEEALLTKIEKLYTVSKQDLELTVAQIMNSLLQNSDLH